MVGFGQDFFSFPEKLVVIRRIKYVHKVYLAAHKNFIKYNLKKKPTVCKISAGGTEVP